MNPSCGPRFSSAARGWVFPKILVLSRTPSPLSGGTKAHHRGTRKRWGSPHRLCILPCTSPHPHHLLFASASPTCPKMLGEMSPNPPSLLHQVATRTPPSSSVGHGVRAVMGRQVTHLMDGGQSWAGGITWEGADPQQQHLKCRFWAENTILLPSTWAPNVVISAHLIFFQYNKDISYFII